MKRIYSILPILFITYFLDSCGGNKTENSKLPICNTKEKFVVAKFKIITIDVFPTEESNGNQVISSDLINLLLPSSCECADEKPLVINSDIYRVDTTAHQKVFNHNDVSKFAGNTAKLKFWQNKAEVIKTTPINDILLQPTKPNNLTQKIGAFILKNSKEDSVFVLANSTKRYLLNGKSYRSFDNVDSVRKNIEQIYQKNPKINFTIILNPPTTEVAVVNCSKWIATGNQKCINNVSHIEEKCETGEVRWVKGGELSCSNIAQNSNLKQKKSKSSKEYVSHEASTTLPKPLNTDGVRVEDVKDGNIKNLKKKNKNQ